VPLISCSVLLKYISPGPGMPLLRQNTWKLGRLLSFGRARCGRSVGGLCLVVCCLGMWGTGLRFQGSDVGVYESFVDGECGNWKAVKFGLYHHFGG
jgi:hypothetical protein